jgi:imidazolonepropionase-like amidohydrolase
MSRRYPIAALIIGLVIATQAFPQRPPRSKADATPADGPSPALPRGLRPKAFALLNAKVMITPGETIEKANIIVRDGVIENVGPDVPVPPDAIKIDVTGKTVCAGFVDALGSWGFDAAVRRSTAGPPSAEDLASEPLVATKPDNRKGVTPEFAVSSALKTDEETADTWRRAGITAHVVAPEGGIVVGQSSVVSLSAGPPRESVLLPTFALHIAFRSPPGNDYPRVLLGVFAHARQLFLDGQHYRRMKDAQAHTGRRVPFDPALDAIGPLLDRKQLVMFEADSRDEIHRALDFAAEFQLRPAIYGGRQAWRAIDRLKKENVPLVLRVNLSEPNEEREKDLTTRAALERNRLRYDERLNAKKLAEAGIEFAIGSMGTNEKPGETFRATVRQWIDAGLPQQTAMAALTTVPARMLGLERTLGIVKPGFAAHLMVCDGDPLATKARVRQVFADGVRFDFDTDEEKKPGGSKEMAKQPKPPALPDTFVGPWSPADMDTEIDADRIPTLHTNGNVLLHGATVLTVANGALTDTDILIRDKKIVNVGKSLAGGDNVTVIDCRGMFIMPGIIDTHSHFASSGGLNEFSLSVVPETRVRDVVDGDDVQIYRAAAGGVTTARLLHGSANCVGGQDAVVKMKYRQPARDIIIHESPRGVKFALGENVKRTDGRFPNTRLGVEAVLIRAFSEARDYQRIWDDYYRAQKEGGTQQAEPRRDLRLEALADILKGDLRVHCHCYRADEILMLLRVADQFGFKIRSLQHVLEGYKIAPEIAAHGASCSLFSDWWAYKIEAFDAIPFAAALLHEAGAMVCLKSDSNELMRHMYQEAAKCVKYGGMSENDALKTITLNGAKQLGLEQRLGSIEVGKDADLAIFNGHPLNGYSRVELTLIDGEVAFQRDKTLKPAEYAQAGPTKHVPKFDIPAKLGTTFSIKGATVHPVSGPVIRDAVVAVRDGKIAAVYSGTVPPQAAPVIPGEGLHVYPGMIDAGTVLGLAELESARETQDYQEGGDFQPDLRAAIAVNPDSELIPVTRANGVLAVVTRPTGSVIAGQGALINLAGWVPREMVIVDPIALHVEFPSGAPFFSIFDPTVSPMSRGLARKQRDDKIRKLKELFQQALAYDAGRVAAPKSTPVNPRLAALVPYAKGEKPVIIQAQRQAEIREALKLAEELKLKMVLSGATDAWKVADELKRRDVPVIVGPTMAMPQEAEDPFDAPYANAAKLHAAGVRFCIRSEGASNARNLPYQAAMAVSYGLPPEEGLKAVTLYPAQILGVADQLGSLDAGKRAHLVITNGDMLQASTQVLAIAIDGKMMPPESKQTKLYDRYRQRLQEVKDGKAILGTK